MNVRFLGAALAVLCLVCADAQDGLVSAARAQEATHALASHFGQDGGLDSPIDRQHRIPMERAPEAISIDDMASPHAVHTTSPTVRHAPNGMGGYEVLGHGYGDEFGSCDSEDDDGCGEGSDEGCGDDLCMDIVDDECCCDDGCGPELGGLFDCCEACPPTGWMCGAGLYYLKPFWQSNLAYSEFNIAFTTVRNTDFNYDYEIAPQLWLQWVDRCGLGARLRYFEFDHSATARATAGPGNQVFTPAPLDFAIFAFAGETMNLFGRVELNVWDFEFTYQTTQDCWTWEVAGGVRYLHTRQRFNAVNDPGAALNVTLDSSHRFNGAGPTVALKSQRKLGQSPLSLYMDGRGSLLFGDQTQRSTLVDPLGAALFESEDSGWSTIGNLELEIGASFQMDFDCVTITATTGVVGQYWSNIGNHANNDVRGLGDPRASQTQDMGLFGLRSTLSIAY